MSPELIAIIGAAIALAAAILPGQYAVRRDIVGLHRDIAGLHRGIAGLHRGIAGLRERMARIEGLFEGLTRRETVAPTPPPA